MRLYRVHVDDPDMAAAHDFVVPALTSLTARYAGARWAILTDRFGVGVARYPFSLRQRVRQACQADLVRAVLPYTRASTMR